MVEQTKKIIEVKDLDPKGMAKEFTVPKKVRFTKEGVQKTIERLENDLVELKEMLKEFD